jgi:hypothetical protein
MKAAVRRAGDVVSNVMGRPLVGWLMSFEDAEAVRMAANCANNITQF